MLTTLLILGAALFVDADDKPPVRRSIAPFVGWKAVLSSMTKEEIIHVIDEHVNRLLASSSLDELHDRSRVFLKLYNTAILDFGVDAFHKFPKFSGYNFGIPQPVLPCFGDPPATSATSGISIYYDGTYNYNNTDSVWSWDEDRLLVDGYPDGTLELSFIDRASVPC